MVSWTGKYIENNGNTFSHLISIGNPGVLKFLKSPDYIMPPQFRNHFERILRLEFYDVEAMGQLQNPKYKNKRMPRKSDIKKIIKFYERTKNNTNGYTVHCWRGIARSTATAFGLLYLIHGDEIKAYENLKKIRPEARPHRQMVKWFDEILGSNLHYYANLIHKQFIDKYLEGLEPVAGLDDAAGELEELEELE